MLLQFCFQPLEQRERISGRASKPRDHLTAFAEPADFFGIGFYDGVSHRDLAVTGDDHLSALANGKNGCAVPKGFAHQALRCSRETVHVGRAKAKDKLRGTRAYIQAGFVPATMRKLLRASMVSGAGQFSTPTGPGNTGQLEVLSG